MKLSTLVFACVFFFYISDLKSEDFKNYRNWYHVKSMVIFDQNHPLYDPFYGIHHVYINRKGLKTIKLTDNRVFPDGTKIAIVFYNHEEAKGSFIEGKKRIEAFMIKNTKKYRDTDGWGYYAFDAKGNSLIKDMKKDCHSCHIQAKNLDYVFSVWKE